MDKLVWFVSRITLIVFAYIILYFGYKGLTTNYREGDSINYHIPIAQAFIDGKLHDPSLFEGERFLKYSPGANELILGKLMFLNIPINIFNVIGLIILFFACFYTGKRFDLNRDISIVFAGSIVILHTMVRWINTQVIDIWLAVWFVLLLGLLQKPEKSLKYFLFLGFTAGMLIGSKYSGPLFLTVLFIFYFRKLWKFIDLKNILVFLFPFILLGLSWYTRNYLVTGNPLYPQGFLWFKDAGLKILNVTVWKAVFLYENGIRHFFNAIISEFGLWAVSIFTPFLFLLKKVRESESSKLILIGSICFLIFLFLPSDRYYNIAVSVFRYSYPVFITFILAIFLLAVKFKKETPLVLFALANMIIVPELFYRPKFVFLMLPVVFLIFYEGEVAKYIKNKVREVNKR